MTTSEYCAPQTCREGRLNIFDNGPCAMQPVFRDYDQKALDDAYDQAVYAPNRDQLLERRNRASEAARRRLGEPQRFAYGAGPNEQLDVYASRTGTHIQVFVHGGAWRAGRAGEYAAPPRCSSAQAHITLPSISITRPIAGAISSRWPIRCAGQSPGCTATQRFSAATPSASMFRAPLPARTSPAWPRPPIGSASECRGAW